MDKKLKQLKSSTLYTQSRINGPLVTVEEQLMSCKILGLLLRFINSDSDRSEMNQCRNPELSLYLYICAFVSVEHPLESLRSVFLVVDYVLLFHNLQDQSQMKKYWLWEVWMQPVAVLQIARVTLSKSKSLFVTQYFIFRTQKLYLLWFLIFFFKPSYLKYSVGCVHF